MNPGASSFSAFKILTGISKTLGVAKEVIPLWQQTKPLIKNARTVYTLIKNVNANKTTKENTLVDQKKIINNTNVNKNNNHIQEKTIIKSNNNPQFFV